MTTLEKLIAGILADRDRERAQINIHNIIARALARFEGKPLTKRIVNYVREQLPKDASVVFDGSCIRVWNVPVFEDYEQRTAHYLPPEHACQSLGGSSLNRVRAFHESSDVCNGEAADRRNADRDDLLESGTVISLARMIDKHNECYQAIQSLTKPESFGHQAQYIALRMLEGTEYHKRAMDEAREALRNKR